MASLFAHVAVPLVARRAIDVPDRIARRLDVIAVLVSIWPDLDYATLPFEVRPSDLLGHRGLTHSLFVAVAVGLAASLAFRKEAAWRRIAAFLVLGIMAVRTRRLGLSIFTHAGFNLVTMIALAATR